jgi:hypothetical protein
MIPHSFLSPFFAASSDFSADFLLFFCASLELDFFAAEASAAFLSFSYFF